MPRGSPTGMGLQAPPADDPTLIGTAEPGGGHEPRRTERLVDSLVQRALDPAMGLASRVLDPLGDDSEGHETARMIVLEALAAVALRTRPRSADQVGDDQVRAVLARVAEASLEALIGHPGSVQLPAEADLPLDRPLRFEVLQDATAALRRVDRQVAYVVLAAGVPATEARVLLGLDPDAVTSSMRRITRRLAEALGPETFGDPEPGPR